jgi:hypothetical protein
LGLSPIEESALGQNTSALTLSAGQATLVDLTGKPAGSGDQTERMLGVMLPHEGRTWFFKLLGTEPVVTREKESFNDFLKSLDFSHVH